MSWNECDSCGESVYTEDNPFVEMRQARASDPDDLATVLAGHLKCIAHGYTLKELPHIKAQSGGVATPKQWADWEAGPKQEETAKINKDKIPFTQFLRPNGTPRQEYIERPKDIHKKAMDIIDKGHRFTMEELMNGVAVFYIEDTTKHKDVAMEMCPNGPKVPATIDNMINEYHAKLFPKPVA